jgi:hypothetical protein
MASIPGDPGTNRITNNLQRIERKPKSPIQVILGGASGILGKKKTSFLEVDPFFGWE